MINHSVHMRDQKANQLAMLARTDRQTLADLAEEVTLVIVLWGLFILVSIN
jgi:hypothetical protein